MRVVDVRHVRNVVGLLRTGLAAAVANLLRNAPVSRRKSKKAAFAV